MLLASTMAVHKATTLELVFLAVVVSVSLPFALVPRSKAFEQLGSAFRFVLILLLISGALGGVSSIPSLLKFSMRLYTWVLLGFLYLGTSSISQIRGTFYTLTCWIPGFPASYFALMISIALSFLPRFCRVLITGREALLSRGGVPWYRPLKKIHALSMPLLLRTVKQSAQLSDALFSRGFHNKRTFGVGRFSFFQTLISLFLVAAYLGFNKFFVYLEGNLRLYSFLR